MCCQVAFLVEASMTHRAWKWFLSGMNPLMYLHVEFKTKPFAANLAFVWFLTCMNYLMPSQLILIKKPSLAAWIRTSYRLIFVSVEVLLQSWLGIENLTLMADITLKAFTDWILGVWWWFIGGRWLSIIEGMLFSDWL